MRMRIVRIITCGGEGAVGPASAAKLMGFQIAVSMITAGVPAARLTPLLQLAGRGDSAEASKALPPFAAGKGEGWEGLSFVLLELWFRGSRRSCKTSVAP